MRRPIRRAFTLMELLVVIGIVVVMTALSIPAISKFMDGQTLQQSGRIMQSAFNESRRAAITQRARNYLVFFREDDPARPGVYRWGARRYREKVGYDGEAQFLLNGAQYDLDPGTTSGMSVGGKPIVGKMRGLQIPIFDGMPPEDDTTVFPNRRPTDGGTPVWLEFRRDGTIQIRNGTDIVPQVDGLFDPNVPIERSTAQFDQLINAATDYDFNIREWGDHAVDKRCLVNVDPNTGRIHFRVLQASE
ncbi:MAG: Tfp pilus assembly protein FimT/FimU [Planctomycetota bacterium]